VNDQAKKEKEKITNAHKSAWQAAARKTHLAAPPRSLSQENNMNQYSTDNFVILWC
jgi:hypothetical protein